MQSSAKGSYRRIIALLLSAFPPSERREMAMAALRDASNKEEVLMPLWGILPSNLNWESSKRWLNGLSSLVLSLGTSSSKDTAAHILARANAISEGLPFAGDPSIQSTDPSLAIALLQASSISPAVAKAIAAEPKTMKYLVECVRQSSNTDVPLAGSFNWSSFLSRLSPKKSVPTPTSSLSTSSPSSPTIPSNTFVGPVVDDTDYDQPNQEVTISDPEPVAPVFNETETPDQGPSSQQVVDEIMSMDQVPEHVREAIVMKYASAHMSPKEEAKMLREKVDQAVESMKVLSTAQKTAMREAEKHSLDVARSSWAIAMLDAPDAVAYLLRSSQPDTTSAKSLLDSLWDIVYAAKTSGDLSTITALTSSIRNALSRGKVTDAFSALAGSLDEIVARGHVEDGDFKSLPTVEELSQQLGVQAYHQDE